MYVSNQKTTTEIIIQVIANKPANEIKWNFKICFVNSKDRKGGEMEQKPKSKEQRSQIEAQPYQ